jgi:uncharacterized membrane protein
MVARETSPQGSGPHESKESGKDVDRIAAFSDAIYAFSMTVLAVEVKVPILTGDRASVAIALPEEMIRQLPHFFSFIIGFLVVALFWTGHHRMFRHIRRVDGQLIWLNIRMLMFIAFMPVPTGYLAEYGDVALIAALYAGVVIAIALLSLILWRHAVSGNLLEKDVNRRLIRLYEWRTLVPAFVFAFSVPIAFTLGATAAEWSWLLIWPIRALIGRQYRDVLPQIYGEV